MEDVKQKLPIIELVPEGSRNSVSLEVVKSAFIAEGKSLEDLSSIYNIPITTLKRYHDSESWSELRKVYAVEGLKKIQNSQLAQAQKLMDIESKFLNLRIAQLESELETYCAYYARHGHLFKTHPVSGEILKNDSGIPIKINVPNVAKELKDLKEGVTMSEGIKQIIDRLENILHAGNPVKLKDVDKLEIIDVAEYTALFDKE